MERKTKELKKSDERGGRKGIKGRKEDRNKDEAVKNELERRRENRRAMSEDHRRNQGERRSEKDESNLKSGDAMIDTYTLGSIKCRALCPTDTCTSGREGRG